MSTAQEEVKALKKDITQIKNMLADQLEETTSNGHSKTIFNKEDLQNVAYNAGKGLRHFFGEKQQQFLDGKEQCENVIKSRPLTSAAVMFAGGMVLSALLRRK